MSLLVSEADLRALLQVMAAQEGEAPSGDRLPESVLRGLYDLIPCDVVSYSDFDPRARVEFCEQEYPNVSGADGAAADAEDPFWRNFWDDLVCSYSCRTGDERTVVMVSDFYTRRQLHELPMYAECVGLLGIEHEIIMCVPTPGDRTRRLHFGRGAGSDFSERDRLLLSLLRPHLKEMLAPRQEASRVAPNLTKRQWQLLQLVAEGNSNDEIAKRLFISPLTVRKHLENIFERLEVTTRAAAVAVALGASRTTHL